MPKGIPSPIIDGKRLCGKCQKHLVISLFPLRSGGSYCKDCFREYNRNWKHTTKRQQPLNENKQCSSYLGVYVAETILARTFRDVIRMPYGNYGYDFICGKGFKVDVKSSCQQYRPRHSKPQWKFVINSNTTADYFACIAFDNRESLIPLYFWLIPSSFCRHVNSLSISESTLGKWGAYRKPISGIEAWCNIMRGVV